jgi:HK97 family phage prohead protease
MSAVAVQETRTVAAEIRFLGGDARRIGCVVNTEDLGRDGIILSSAGLSLANYEKNAVVLYQHDNNRPIARCTEIVSAGSAIKAIIEFPPQGVSDDADMVWRLVKANIVGAISIGYVPHEAQPIPGVMGGRRITKSELLEISIVSVPALPTALVTQRAFRPSGDRSTIAGRRAVALAWQAHAHLAALAVDAAADRRQRALVLAERHRARWRLDL